MALGDDAIAAGMDIVEPTDDRREGANEITLTRDYIAQFGIKPGTALTLARGGTGATTAAAARTALGLQATVDDVAAGTAELSTGTIVRRRASNGTIDAAGFYTNQDPAGGDACTRRSWVEAAIQSAVGGIDLSSRVAKTGDTMTGNLFLPNSTAATAGYTIAYINNDGRVSRGASSERYKENIEPADLDELAGVFDVPLDEFEMIGGDGTRIIGRIAEKLADNPATARFVIWLPDPVTGEPRIESYDMIAILHAQTAVLDARVKQLEARLEQMEADRA